VNSIKGREGTHAWDIVKAGYRKERRRRERKRKRK